MKWLHGTLICACLSLACDSVEQSVTPSAEIGVFFGGQIQRVKTVAIPAVNPPKIGFRIHLPIVEHSDTPAPSESRAFAYEVVRPGPTGRRVTKEGTVTLPVGQITLDHVLPLDAQAKMGIWNLRVTWNEIVLADRALFLTRPK